ncbi:hypothetical protein B0I32_10887 [Nonomuraea fuscirosea]|uniref:NHL repeat-containing protein n=1 Tax=Nonomuraea fuscirosea TaxID=1291556 RepID=A0A2T0MZA4_9ACTN|nr:hypothetical protein B0I32_10887 [Nonomuraea fuscirosea]
MVFTSVAGVLQWFIGDDAGLVRRLTGLLATAVAALFTFVAWERSVARRRRAAVGFCTAAVVMTGVAAIVLWSASPPAESPPAAAPSKDAPPPSPLAIFTLAGDFPAAVSDELASYQRPMYAGDLVVTSDGNLLATSGATIERITRDRAVELVAGRPFVHGTTGDGGAALDATFDSPAGVAVRPDGAVVLTDDRAQALRIVSEDGKVSSIPAVGEDELKAPGGIAVTADGRTVVADFGGHRVVAVDDEGRLTVIAGTGFAGFGGDGGPAVAARLREPSDVEVLPDGSLIIVDQGNARIRRVSADGTIDTIAGAGPKKGRQGSGLPATASRFGGAMDAAVRPDGGILIVDTESDLLRTIAADGTLRTLAGDRTPVDRGDGGPPEQAGLADPSSVAVAPDGVVFVATASRVRAIGRPEHFGRWTATPTTAQKVEKPTFSGWLWQGPGMADLLLRYLAEHQHETVYLDVRIEAPDKKISSYEEGSNTIQIPDACSAGGSGPGPGELACDQDYLTVHGDPGAFAYESGWFVLRGDYRWRGSYGPRGDMDSHGPTQASMYYALESA